MILASTRDVARHNRRVAQLPIYATLVTVIVVVAIVAHVLIRLLG